MKRIATWIAALALGTALASCAHRPAPIEAVTGVAEIAQDDVPRVLLIGIDGLRPDIINPVDTPKLFELAQSGTTTKGMIPVMPSVTFVNFYTLATGQYPEHHGLVDKGPYDRDKKKQFCINNDGKDRKWLAGEPIWETAEKQGLNTAVLYWISAEVPEEGTHLRIAPEFSYKATTAQRVKTVAGWFDGPKEKWPRLTAMYIQEVDSAGHTYGPDSEEYLEAAKNVDAQISILLNDLASKGVKENLTVLIVSDHGMTDVDSQHLIRLERAFDFNKEKFQIAQEKITQENKCTSYYHWNPYLEIYDVGGGPEAVDAAYHALKNLQHIQVWKRGEMPAHYHIDHPDRGPDLLVVADEGWLLSARAGALASDPGQAGTHGYDNHLPSMQATFIGNGPIFPKGQTVGRFENVNVNRMVACALGITPAETDADVDLVEQITGGRCPAR